MTYTLSDVQAMKSKPYTYGQGFALSTADLDGAAWQPIGYFSEDAWETANPGHGYAKGGLITAPVPVDVQRCPHCNRDWHTEPLTRRVADMVHNHRFDPTYKAAEDDSPIVCVGSDVYGPNRPPEQHSYAAGYGYGPFTIVDEAISMATSYMQDMVSLITGIQLPPWTFSTGSWWSMPEPICAGELPEVDVRFGPEHWPIERQRRNKLSDREAVRKINPQKWMESIPVPEYSGLDVSTLVEQFNKKHNPPKYESKGFTA